MKRMLACCCILVACCGWGDAINDVFLSLRAEGRTALTECYHSLSNGWSGFDGAWETNGMGAMIFTVTNTCGGVSNMVYDIEFMRSSTNVVVTNVCCICKVLMNGEKRRFAYGSNGLIEMIEHEFPERGSFRSYQTDSHGDLEAYLAATNFVPPHGIFRYRNGVKIDEYTSPPKFLELLRLLKDSQ